MKYQKEIDEIFESFHQWWMDDWDKQMIKRYLLEFTSTTEQDLSDKIEEGVKNGYSVEHQMELIKELIKK